MEQYSPPIKERETDELISIAHSNENLWQRDAIKQAKRELLRRGVSEDYQNKVLEEFKQADKRIEEAWQQQKEKNKVEGYKLKEMVYIFLVAPFILLGKWRVGFSLMGLKSENFKRKFKQRLLLLIAGTAFWVTTVIYFSERALVERNQKLQEQVQEVDLSEWEKLNYGSDSLE